MEMNSFLILFLLFLFGLGAYFIISIKNAPFIDDYDEPYEHTKKNPEEELDPTELFQATKDVKIDTSNWKKDETQYEQEEGLFDEGKSKHDE